MLAPNTTDLFLFNGDLNSATGSGRSLTTFSGISFVSVPPPPTNRFGEQGFAAAESNSALAPLQFLTGLSHWTAEFRAFIPSGGTQKMLISWKEIGDTQIYISSKETGVVEICWENVTASGGSINFDDYNYFALVGTGTAIKGYLNNVEIASITVDSTMPVFTPLAFIGNWVIDSAQLYADGVIVSDLRFSNVTRTSFPTVDPIPPIPGPVEIDLLLRKGDQTILSWNSVANGSSGDITEIIGYNIYRSTNANLETFELVTQVVDLGANGLVQTIFNEKIAGYFAYGISAFNLTGEGPITTVAATISSFDLDSLD